MEAHILCVRKNAGVKTGDYKITSISILSLYIICFYLDRLSVVIFSE
jgi:hypothetical protein